MTSKRVRDLIVGEVGRVACTDDGITLEFLSYNVTYNEEITEIAAITPEQAFMLAQALLLCAKQQGVEL